MHAAFHDPFNDGLGDFDAQFARRVIVQEEQGLRALHHDVIGTHGDQVDADGVMTCRLDRQSQLGSNAIRAGNQHRFAVAIDGNFEERTESAKSCEHFRPHRTFDRGFNALDELITGFDVDASVFVGNRIGRGHTASRELACGILHALCSGRGPVPSSAVEPCASGVDIERMVALRWKNFLVGVLAIAASTVTHAVTVPDLYEVTQPVQTTRDAAFVDALKTVVVRVSGQRDAPTKLGASLNNPRQYVQKFGFTTDGTLEVGFDSVSVERLLSNAGVPIWGRERPAVLVLFEVNDSNGGHLVDGQSPNSDRELLNAVGRDRGLPLRWPNADVQPTTVNASSTAELLQFATRLGANAVLSGRQIEGGQVRWRLISNDGVAETVGSAQDGVQFAADAFARTFAASGSQLGSVAIEVSGISNLDAYASTLNYLEGLTLVRAVAVEQASGDRMRFKLSVRGDAETLRRAIGLEDRLVPEPAASTSDLLAFRFQH